MKQIVTISFLLISALFLFTVCSLGGTKMESKSSDIAGKENRSAVVDEAENTKITITSGDAVIEAELDGSETSKEFIATLPVTLKMKRSDEREYYARIPKLSENGMEISPEYENGDVTYYKAGPSFAIFFGRAGESAQGNLIRMGKVTSDLALFNQLGEEAEITIEKNRLCIS